MIHIITPFSWFVQNKLTIHINNSNISKGETPREQSDNDTCLQTKHQEAAYIYI